MRTKRRRVEELVASTSSEALKKAAERLTGSNTNEKISVESALALYIDMDLSMRQYNMMRKVVNSIHKDCFPSYYMIAESKKKILPDDIQLTESSAEVPLQKILDKTVRSILDVNDIDTNNDIVLECKWGFDGSSGHSVYKQKFQDEEASDEFMFVTSFVPLRLLDWADDQIVWENDRHSSWRLCRPLKIIFTKENPSIIQSVRDSINTEIEGLDTYNYISKNKNLNVHYKMQLTMIDGAVLNVLSGNSSSSTCALCGAKPSEMSSLSIFERPVNEQCYQYGLSTLHAWIKCFECILHISYKQPIKKWRVVGKEDKDQVAEQKRSIQAKFKSEMGLIVDKVKTGYGTTNDGNTARRFFSNVELSAQITNVDVSLIKNFSIILRTLSSGHYIHTSNFEKLLKDTALLYFKLYPWYYMPATVHKILVHGIDFIKYSTIPIGMLSEEAIETSHKIIRNARLKHTRKRSRIASMGDLLNYLILQSEPSISMHSQKILLRKSDINDLKEYLVTKERFQSIKTANLVESESDDSDSC